ncbi:MAG: cupredoxin domain-containing protein [Dehalococcoidia bacterium]
MRWTRLFLLPLALASALLLVAACSDSSDDANPTESATEAASATSTSEGSATVEAASTESATSSATAEATSTATSESTSTPESTPESTSTATASSTSSPESGDNDYETEIEDFAFEQGITVPVGTTVRWENRDGVPHTVSADDDAFDSGLIETNETFEVVFDAAGSFSFHCNVHPSMTGTIAVQ